MSDVKEKPTQYGQKKESTFEKYFAHVDEKEIEQTDELEQQVHVENTPISSERSMSRTADSIMFKNDEQVTLLPYSYLKRSDFKEQTGLKLTYIGTDVTIKGKNLLPLLQAIQRKKAYFIQQNHKKYDKEEDGKVWIDQIIISEPK